MKQLSFFTVLLMIMTLVVSCATTGTQEIPDAYKEVTVDDYDGHQIAGDALYSFICDFAAELKDGDENIAMTKDDKALAVKLEGMRLCPV